KVPRAEKMGIQGTRARVRPIGDSRVVHDQAHHRHDHDHGHHHRHDHHHGHDHGPATPHAPHRTYRDIKRIIEEAPFADSVKSRVAAMFLAVGQAEADIHGFALDEVHFHEVGATDSIVDIFGAAIALDYLKVDVVLSGAVEVGAGNVRCEHGMFPVPAPATAEILKGVPCRFGGVDGEATTPTGAAILKCTVDHFAPTGRFVPESIGYGIG